MAPREIKHGPRTDGRGRRALRDTSRTKYFMKIGCDHRLASAIIGQNGEKIKKIVQNSKAFIKLSKKGNWYPNTEHQVLLVGGQTIDCLRVVLSTIMQELDQVVQGNGIESSNVKFVIHEHAVYQLLAEDSRQLNEIRAFGCKVEIDHERHNVTDNILESVVHLSGPVASLNRALNALNDVVQSYQSQAWYLPWGSHWILLYADEMMNRYDREQNLASISPPPSANHTPKFGSPVTSPKPEVAPDSPPFTALCDNVQKAIPNLFSTATACDVSLTPQQANFIRNGHIQSIESISGAKLNFLQDRDGFSPLSITGTPLCVYSAHLLVMSRIVQSMQSGTPSTVSSDSVQHLDFELSGRQSMSALTLPASVEMHHAEAIDVQYSNHLAPTVHRAPTQELLHNDLYLYGQQPAQQTHIGAPPGLHAPVPTATSAAAIAAHQQYTPVHAGAKARHRIYPY